MIILIDGYNLLKSITGTKFINDKQMRGWMYLIEEYAQKRNNKVLIVFDAGPSFFESHEKMGSIDVYYAGQYQTADDWIKVWLEKNKQRDILLVSSDREIRNWASGLNVTSMSSQDFYRIFNLVLQEEKAIVERSDYLGIYKTKQDEPNDEILDQLMNSAIYDVDFIETKSQDDKAQSLFCGKKASKKDKALLKKIDKI